jgi:hypothetical protein
VVDGLLEPELEVAGRARDLDLLDRHPGHGLEGITDVDRRLVGVARVVGVIVGVVSVVSVVSVVGVIARVARVVGVRGPGVAGAAVLPPVEERRPGAAAGCGRGEGDEEGEDDGEGGAVARGAYGVDGGKSAAHVGLVSAAERIIAGEPARRRGCPGAGTRSVRGAPWRPARAWDEADRPYERVELFAGSDAFGRAVYARAWLAVKRQRHHEARERFVRVIEHTSTRQPPAPNAAALAEEARRHLVVPFVQVGTPPSAATIRRWREELSPR